MFSRSPSRLSTETDPIPNPVVGHSERAEGKSKKEEGIWEPKSERVPNRHRTESSGASMSGMVGTWAQICEA